MFTPLATVMKLITSALPDPVTLDLHLEFLNGYPWTKT